MRRALLKILFLSLTLVLLGTASYRALFQSDLIKLKEIVIEGASAENTERIKARVKSTIGSSFWRLDLNSDVQSIRQDSWVESVQISRRWPSTLVVTVTEKKPVAIVGSGKGDLRLIDQNNSFIAEAQSEQLAELPIILGTEFINSKPLTAQALELYQSLPKEGLVSQRDVSNIEYDEERGFQLRLTRQGVLIDLGKQDLPLKTDRARRVVQYLDQHQVSVSHIDADYSKKVLVKVRKR